MSKLEVAEYIEGRKEFLDKKPHTILKLTSRGREAFRKQCSAIDHVFKDLPE